MAQEYRDVHVRGIKPVHQGGLAGIEVELSCTDGEWFLDWEDPKTKTPLYLGPFEDYSTAIRQGLWTGGIVKEVAR